MLLVAHILLISIYLAIKARYMVLKKFDKKKNDQSEVLQMAKPPPMALHVHRRYKHLTPPNSPESAH